MRDITVLSHDWEHTTTDPTETGKTTWTTVTLPHCTNPTAEGDTLENDRRGPSWYRRRLHIPEISDGRRAVVSFGAAGTVARVRVNGRDLGSHRGGYSTFRHDVTDALDDTGSGELVVEVDNAPTADVYPLAGDHTTFGGLYRPVHLIVVDPVHIDLNHHGGPGVIVTQGDLDDDHGELVVTVRVTNTTAATMEHPVHLTLSDADGRAVTTAHATEALAPGTTEVGPVTLVVDRPRRWHGRRDPYRYRLAVTVADDRVELPVGLRTFTIDPARGVLLNGEPYRLHGVSRHHDVDGTPAVTPDQIATDFDLIDEIGASAVRLAHYQHDDVVLEECDRRGIVVWAEIPVNAQVSATDPLGNARSQLTELITQQRHHPSILCWGVQNETLIGERAVDPRPVIADLAALAHELDPTRPVTQAQLFAATPGDPINALGDLNALNLYAGWYYGESADATGPLDRHHAQNPDTPIGLSEYGADARIEFHAADPVPGDYTEEYQALLHEEYWKLILERPWIWGSFVWNMFDFASVIRDEGGTRGFNMKGLVTRDRTERKDAFWWYKANWNPEPMLHLCAKRFVDRVESTIEVKVYANVDAVDLEVGGRPLGTVRSDDHRFCWTVTLGPGETTITARAGDLVDHTVVRLVDTPAPGSVCPDPRRRGTGSMTSWFDGDPGSDGAIDRSRFGPWSLVGDLLDDPGATEVLTTAFGRAILEHPMIDAARALPLETVVDLAAASTPPEEIRALYRALYAVDAATPDEEP